MNEVVEMAKSEPQLVQLMHLYQYFPTVEALERVQDAIETKVHHLYSNTLSHFFITLSLSLLLYRFPNWKARSFNRQRLLRKLPMVSEASCQVDTHIVDGHIDVKYEWNEWELRRQALMLVKP